MGSIASPDTFLVPRFLDPPRQGNDATYAGSPAASCGSVSGPADKFFTYTLNARSGRDYTRGSATVD